MKLLLPFLLIVQPSYHDASFVIGDPIQTAEWVATPDIVICTTAPVRLSRVERAAEYWRRLGYEIGRIVEASATHKGCLGQDAFNGEIVIDLSGQTFRIGDNIAVTKTWFVKESREIFKARIEITSGWGDSPRILEHELGHAFGFRDYNQTGHIMHSEWSKGGLKFKGLQRK